MKSALVASCAILSVSVPAHAQDNAETSTSSLPGTGTSAQSDVGAAGNQAVEDIVVTGSRLGASGYSAPTPVTVLGAANIETRAPASVADFVNQVPSFRQTSGPGQNQRFPTSIGQNLLDLRGLGPSRTLLLIDGRRQSTADTNTIPVSLVDRVEVITGGASAAYGSDAVSGVANFILKHKIDGLTGTLQYGLADAGDSAGVTVNLAGGASFGDGRGHLIAGIDYSENSGIGAISSRSWGQALPANVSGGAGRTGDIAAQNFLTNVMYSAQTRGGVITSGPLAWTAFGPGGSTYQLQRGSVFSNLMVGGNNADANPNNNFSLQIPLKRLAALARLDYDVSDTVNIFAEGAYSRTETHGFTSFAQLPAIRILSDNPYLPASVLDAMNSAGVNSISVGRIFTELGGYQLPTQRETLRGAIGASGSIFDGWKWNASYQYSQSTDKAQITTNIILPLLYQAAYVVRDASGNAVCGPLDSNPTLTAAQKVQIARFQAVNPSAVCAPMNIFGQGSPSAASLNYIQGAGISNWTNVRNTLQVAAADLRGSPFSTWAGPVQVALGGEYRHEQLRSRADPIGNLSLWNTSNTGDYDGSQNVKEGFVEVGVPLAKDVPFAHALDLNGAFRYTDYSLSGAVRTWKLGATYEPLDGVRLRVTRSRDIRAPNLVELFQSGTTGTIASILNPLNGQTGLLNTALLGNRSLKPEIADTWTGGIVLQPQASWARGFRAAVDFYSIKVDKVIASISATEVLRRCAAGQADYCSLITFDSSTFGIASLALQPANLNKLSERGLDFDISYRIPVGSGTVDIHALATHVLDLKITDASGTIDRAGSLQNSGVPSWSGTVDLTYANRGFSGTLTGRYFSSSLYDASLIGPGQDGYSPSLSNSISKNRLPARTYFDLALSQDIIAEGRRKFQVFATVRNLLDKDPPVEALFINSGGNPYDLVGRSYTVGVRFAY